MIKRIYGLILVASCLALAGCDKSQAPEKSSKDPITAPGVDQLQSLTQKADVLYQTRDYMQSAKVYRQIVTLDVKNLKAHYRLGNIAFRAQEWRTARSQYEKVIDLEPRHTRAQYNLAMTYLTLAERHLKFYAANVDASANLESVTKLITALEDISNPGASSRQSKNSQNESNDSPLDKLLETLSQ